VVRVEEVAAHEVGPVTDAADGEDPGCAGDHVGKVVKHAAHVRVCRQDGREHRAVRAADIDDRLDAVERQGRDRGCLEPAGQVRHRAGEPGGMLGVCDNQVKNGSPYRCSAADWPVRTVWMRSANGA